MKLLKLKKNQKEVANGQVLSVLPMEKNMSLQESLERNGQGFYIEANSIIKNAKAHGKSLGLKGKDLQVHIRESVDLIPNLDVKKAGYDLLDVFYSNTLKEQYFQLGIAKFDIVDGHNVLTFAVRQYLNNGKLFGVQTLGQFVVPEKTDVFTSMDSTTEISDKNWKVIQKILEKFSEDREKFDTLEQVLNSVDDYISEKTSIRHATRELVQKFRVEI